MNTFGSFLFKSRKLVLLIWTVIVIALGFFAIKLPSILGGSGFEYDGTYDQVEQILDQDFDIPQSSIILLFENKTGTSDKEFESYISQTLKVVEGIEGAGIYQSPLDSKDMMKEDKAYALLDLHAEDDQIGELIASIRKDMKENADFSVGLTGGHVIEEDMNKAAQDDLVRAELIGIPIAIIVLLLAFKGVIAALIPLVTGFVSVIAALGLLYFTGQKTELSIFVLNTAPMIGLALGIDFALLFVNRFREELANKTVDAAVSKTVATSGKTIIFSGLCVLLGMIGMLFIDVGVFRSVAIGGVAVVFTSVLAANTFLPALLSVLGPNINKWMLLRSREKGTGGWHRFASFVMKRPGIMAVLASALLITGALPVGKMDLAIPGADALPKSFDSRTAYEKFEETFSSDETVTVPVVVKAKDPFTEETPREDLEKLVHTLQDDPLVSKTESIFSATNMNAEELNTALGVPQMAKAVQPALDQLTQGKQALIRVTLDADASSDKAKEWVREWNEKDAELSLLVGGHPKFQQEIFDEIYDKLFYSLGFILLSTYIVLFVAFRSVLIPLKAILMNIISLSCTFGIVVWLFQGGHLGFHPSDIALMIPVFAFSIVFGLSMDYEVFLISRIHEVYLKTGDNDQATLEGLVSTSTIITSAAAIMIVITGAFAFTGVVPVQQMGVTVAIAIFIDATIVRMVLVPSLMKLLGDLNWWAPFHKKKHQLYN